MVCTSCSVGLTSAGRERRSSQYGDSIVLSSTSRMTTSSIGIWCTRYGCGGVMGEILELLQQLPHAQNNTAICFPCLGVKSQPYMYPPSSPAMYNTCACAGRSFFVRVATNISPPHSLTSIREECIPMRNGIGALQERTSQSHNTVKLFIT